MIPGNDPRDLTGLVDIFLRCWSSRTSSTWSAETPSRGQCAVTALVIHDHFGGEILKTPVGGQWHFYNRLAGCRLDLTADQFSAPIDYRDVSSSRAEAFMDAGRERYDELSRAYASCLDAERRQS